MLWGYAAAVRALAATFAALWVMAGVDDIHTIGYLPDKNLICHPVGIILLSLMPDNGVSISPYFPGPQPASSVMQF